MSATTVKLLQAAASIVGSTEALAERLAIDETLLGAYLADRREMPDPLLLRTVDIILADRGSELRLPNAAENLQNCRREAGAAAGTGPD